MIDVADPQPSGPRTITSHASDAARQQSSSPEARWSDKGERGVKVNLYSQNVLQEADSSEVVDRESIANLATTRRQWETITTSDTSDNPAPRSKGPSKWEVRVPYAQKNPAPSSTRIPEPDSAPTPDFAQPSSFAPPPVMSEESAIEREIRLALEREQTLKREQEERLGLSAMESSTESELQPDFHELTEADRGSQFLMHERAVQRQDAQLEEALQKRHPHQRLHSALKSGDNEEESIIEREIRLQREREAELAQQRAGRSGPPSSQSQRVPPPHPPAEPEDRERSQQGALQVEEIPYEEAISRYNHEGESRIAQELRELREREEEVRQLREKINRTALDAGGDAPPAKPPASQAQPPSSSFSHRQASTPQKSVNVSRNVHASPQLDVSSQENHAPSPRHETPIEREIRLVRERENELRRAKGMPELPSEPVKQESFETPQSEEQNGPARHYFASQPSSSMQRFASNRLQQEINDQRNREMKLRQEGKIISTSEEHIQPLRYTDVVGEDRDSSPAKRNFTMPGRRMPAPNVEHISDPGPRPTAAATPPVREGAGGKKGTGLSFSYREFAQTAESKIERELREMREREEELRKQRNGGLES